MAAFNLNLPGVNTPSTSPPPNLPGCLCPSIMEMANEAFHDEVVEKVRYGRWVLVVVGFALLCFVAAQSQETDWATLIEAAKPAVVWILAESPGGVSAGSGAIISPNGYILTAAHVIEGASRIIVVVEESREFHASVVQADYEMDVAVLKISATNLTWLSLGNSDQVQYEQEIRVLGYPLPGHAGVGFAAVGGKIQGFRTSHGIRLLQHDAPTEGGHSGGPVINAQGEIIAVHTGWIGGEHTKYTIGVAINSARAIIPQDAIPTEPSPVFRPSYPVLPKRVIKVPDDVPSLKGAVRLAPAGAEIHLAAGKWEGPLEITKPLTLIGEDGATVEGLVTIRNTRDVILQQLILLTGLEAEDVRGLVLESVRIPEGGKGVRRGWGGEEVAIGIFLTRVEGARFKDCEVVEAAAPLALHECSGITFVNCTFPLGHWERRTFIANSNHIGFYGCNLQVTGRIYMSNAQDIELDNSKLYGSFTSESIIHIGGKSSVTFSACEVDAVSLTISASDILNSPQVSIANCNLQKSHIGRPEYVEFWALRGDILVEDSSFQNSSIKLTGEMHLRIKNSSFERTEKWYDIGISLGGQSRASIRNCTFRNDYSIALELDGAAEAEVKNCTFIGNGISCANWSQYATLTGYGNDMEGNKCDLVGNISPGFRRSLRPSTAREITFPASNLSSLQEAVDALKPGGVLLLKPGEYEAGITVGKVITIRSSDGTVVLRAPEGAPAVSLIQNGELTLEDVVIEGGYPAGILAWAPEASVVLRDCYIRNCRTGVDIRWSHAIINGCHIENNELMGIRADWVGSLEIDNCVVQGNIAGIFISHADDTRISDCTIVENGGGIKVQGRSIVMLERNTITSNRTGVRCLLPSCLGKNDVSSFYVFVGSIVGMGNSIYGNEEKDVCPEELSFLTSPRGGTLDTRNKFFTISLRDSEGKAPRGAASLSFSPDGKLLAWGVKGDTPEDFAVELFDIRTGEVVSTLIGGSWPVTFSPDGKMIASGSIDGVRLWKTETGEIVRVLEMPTVVSVNPVTGERVTYGSIVEGMAFSPDGRVLAIGGNCLTWGFLELYTVPSWRKVRSLIEIDDEEQDDVTSVAFTPDGRLLAAGLSGYKHGKIRIWEAATGRLVRTLTGHSGGVLSVAFSPDGRRIASSSKDKTIKLWDTATGRLIRTLSGHRSWVTSVAFSPDGTVLASGSHDHTVKLWDVKTGTLLISLDAKNDVEGVSFSPDGRFLVATYKKSGSKRGGIVMWDVSLYTGK